VKNLNFFKKIISLSIAGSSLVAFVFIPNMNANAQHSITQEGAKSLRATVHIDDCGNAQNTAVCIEAAEYVDGVFIPRNISPTCGEHVVMSKDALSEEFINNINRAAAVAGVPGVNANPRGAVLLPCQFMPGAHDVDLVFPNPGCWCVTVKYKDSGEMIGNKRPVRGLMNLDGSEALMNAAGLGSLISAEDWAQYGPRKTLASKVLNYTSDLNMTVKQEVIRDSEVFSTWNLKSIFKGTSDMQVSDPKPVCTILDQEGKRVYSVTGNWDDDDKTSSWSLKIPNNVLWEARIEVPGEPNLTYIVNNIGEVIKGNNTSGSIFYLPQGTVKKGSDSFKIEFANVESNPNVELKFEATDRTSDIIKKGKLSWDSEKKELSADFTGNLDHEYKVLVFGPESSLPLATLYTKDEKTDRTAVCTATKAEHLALFNDSNDEDRSSWTIVASVPEKETLGFEVLVDNKVEDFITIQNERGGFVKTSVFVEKKKDEKYTITVKCIGKDGQVLYTEERSN
jgi:hypothetical protein